MLRPSRSLAHGIRDVRLAQITTVKDFLIAGEWPLPRIHLFPTAGLEKKNYQPVCVLNLEILGLVEGS
jgi:hypothetical protein